MGFTLCFVIHSFLYIVLNKTCLDLNFKIVLLLSQVKNIELSFNSVDHYFGSHVYPLLEETRAQLCSSMEILSCAPFAEVVSLSIIKSDKKNFYEVSTDSWKNRSSGNGKEPYKILSGDVFILADFKPETAEDLLRVGKIWCLASSVGTAEERIQEDRDFSSTFEVVTSKYIDHDELREKSFYLVFLTNIIPSRRIWKALHMSEEGGKSKFIEKILCAGDVVKETCDYCSEQIDAVSDVRTLEGLSSELNQSQYNAICACLSSVHCNHKPTVDLIWGPPGTGKTKTLGTLLFALLKKNCRTLVCAPTNVAIKEVASRVVSMVRESFRKSDDLFCPLGDMLLFGNNERLKVDADIVDIYLDYRVEQLTTCFAPQSGWLSCIFSMIDLLENSVSDYHICVENKLIKEQEQINDDNSINMTEDEDHSDCSEGMCSSFLDFVREKFLSKVLSLKDCVSILCTHVPRSYILEDNFKNLVCLFHLLDSFQALLFQSNIVSEVLEELFSPRGEQHSSSESFMGAEYLLYKSRSECLSLLRSLRDSLGELNLPHFLNQESIREFCLRTSSLIFCTASSSFKLHSVAMKPVNILVIDEAAQLKESESIIPLLLPKINHAILVGDERQLPALVLSNVSHEAGFGRSLFGRLSSLDHPNHLLNIQYRMHPAISSFPNSHFYLNQILDAPNVDRKKYLLGPMFGPYSFIDIVGGREESDEDGRSRKNMVEVAVVMKILKNCFKAWLDSKDNISIGIVSPYAAQVVALKDQIGRKYDSHDGFNVNVKTIDGFQGGELDIIILSTVRTSGSSSLGFISSPQRTNVALTRARHCLWILGNSKILTSQDNVWKHLVLDALNRHCFFSADDDKDLAKSIWDAKKELDQFDDLLNGDSLLFKNSRWKFTFHSYALLQVLFSDYFLKSFKNLKSERTKKSVINLLLKLSSGWRPKRIKVDLLYGNSSGMLKQFKVEGIFVLCSKDIVKESNYTQVLKIWDVLPPEDIPKLVKRLDSIFGSYTDDFISRCNEKIFEGNMEVPIMWEKSVEIMKFKNIGHNGDAAESSVCSDQRIYVENSKVEESLLLMKFYSLSPVVVSHLLSDRIGNEIDLPFEVTDEEREIILFPRSTFVLGRSGTGKTTVLTMKLFQKENLHHMAVEETYGMDSAAAPSLNLDEEYKGDSTMNDRPVLRQLFVTVSPKLCQAVKHHVVRLKRSLCGVNVSTESSSIEEDSIDIDASVLLRNIPDSFVDLPTNSYPLVITFQKFLMMLDGTLGNSFFERFSDISSHSQNLGVRSIVLETFIRNKEVTYDRFDSLYWPHFNSQYTKKLDASRVFTEIISHIKGGIQSTEPGDGKLSREGYLSLSENRASSLSKQQRMMIYDIYQSYEKMKMDKGDYDLADIVIDLHHRLRIKSYTGDEMSFVYIDEVQDLTMSQIALFKYVCQNVDEGFVFCGDTAQTIARGIDFRFQDIKSLFYKMFVLESKKSSFNKGKEKVKVSEIFLLKNNFRTHAGVLRLSQSTIDLLYRFFPYSIDVLEPETSSISGEAPVVLECGNRENAIVTIFGNNGNVGGKIVGFGAEQVILVRDDSARKEILDYVGKNALVLTILECKGLEFQDVLLYNFFGSSPLKNRWRVIYEFMKEQDMLDPTELKSYQSFNDSKHNILCSELKQLYVAVTRTRQRLWISENTEEFSRPMFEYWNKKYLVQFKELDDSLAQAMKVASSPEEWKSRGIKLYLQNNYEMATMCFERAGDTYWERRSKAAGLRASANHLRDINPEDANATLREAAEIFEGIGLADIAAQCFSDLGDHERAGMNLHFHFALLFHLHFALLFYLYFALFGFKDYTSFFY
ncbi:putative tetratricopeptide-like helical domain, uvrD-like helicase, ATP-binding protein [Lupinus albus]|uniref:Putative tetratricopeptide-like helical domain, uvrD-like helicase, ATP-binding protein n=1 Tax=Lupinus albus TaxID=3870 RepID=A0A6A4QAE2_LUPAL|nr:putative tetratricopeptide-like helical domain, uvrD-like helicase, ATP-binding protein [Lupinus albus]